MTEASAKVLPLYPRYDDEVRRLLSKQHHLSRKVRAVAVRMAIEEHLGDRRLRPVTQAELDECIAVAQNALNAAAYSLGTDPPVLLNDIKK
jgi:hypothetical protein